MPVNPTLETISDKITAQTEQELNLATFYSQEITAVKEILNGILSTANDTLSTLQVQLGPIRESIEIMAQGFPTMLDNQSQMIVLLDQLVTNGSRNAQNGQTVALNAAASCCGDDTFSGDRAPDLCARLQKVIDRVFLAMQNLTSYTDLGRLPTVQEILDRWRFVDFGLGVGSLMDRTGANILIAGIAERGQSGLGALEGLADNQPAKDALRQAIFDQPNAKAAYNALQYYDFSQYGISEEWASFLRLGFPVSLINKLFDTMSGLNGDGYDNNICAPPPPPPDEPDWSDDHQLVVDDEGPDISDNSRIFTPNGEGPPDGGRFGIRLTNVFSGSFFNAQVLSLPDEQPKGSLFFVGDEVTFTLEPQHTGARIIWGQAFSGEEYHVEWLRVGYND